MIKRKHWELFSKAVLIVLVVLLASEPVLVAAMPNEVNERQEAIDSFTASGDVYLSSVTAALTANTTLVGALAAIQATPIDQLSENAVLQTRATALDAAESSAVALGSIDDVAASVESIGGNLPAAFDAYQRAGEGLPQQTRTDLITEAGLSSADVDAMSAGMDDLLLTRQDMALNGMPAATASQLAQAGFSQEEINRIAVVAGNRGLANTSLTTSLAQFRSSQDEWANVRTQMLMINVQLMGYQIAARQAAGINARAVTETELQEIAEDELRLLVHVAHLQELWGTDPDLNEGEGDWWFIEHYAGRAAERLDALVIESQNRALIADLFVLQEMRLLALSARNGDAAYVKQELDGLGKTLEYLVGDQTFIARQRDEMQGITYAVARLASLPSLRERVKWNIQESDRNHTIRHARVRLDALGVQNLSVLFGQIQEQNESNNRKSIVFMSGFSQIDQATRALLEGIISLSLEIGQMQLVDLIWAILSGDTDNPLLVFTNIMLGMIPVINVITDIFALIAEDGGMFIRAVLLFALFCDIGEILAWIPGFQIAAAGYIGGALTVVIRRLYRLAEPAVKYVLNGLRITDAFHVVVDLVEVISKKITQLNPSLGSINQMISFLDEIFKGGLRLWDDFVVFVREAGTGLLLRWGVNENTLFLGRVLRALDAGISLSDDALAVLKRATDDLVSAGVSLSDDAAEGLARATKIFGGYELQGFVSRIRVNNPGQLDSILSSMRKLDMGGFLDAGRNFKGKVGLEKFTDLVSKYGTNPDNLADIQKVFTVLGDPAVSREAVQAAMNQSPEAARAFAGWGDVLKNNDSIARQLAQRATKDAATLAIVRNWSYGTMPPLDELIAIGKNSRDGVGTIWGLGPNASSYTSGFVDFARSHNAQFYYTHPEYGAKVNAIFPGSSWSYHRDLLFWDVNKAALDASGGPIPQGMRFIYDTNTQDALTIEKIFTQGASEASVAADYGGTLPFRIRELFLLKANGYVTDGKDALGNYFFKP